jgi:hypothetical protein
LRQFADERIFLPRGMKNTHYFDDVSEIIPQRAAGYSPASSGYRVNFTALDIVGPAGVYSTIEDLARWDGFFFNSPPDLAPLLARLQQPVVLNNGKKVEWGLSLILEPWGKRRAVVQAGTWAGHRAEFLRLPEEHFSVICLCNRSDSDPAALTRRVARLYFPDGPAGKPTGRPSSGDRPRFDLPENELRGLEGSYRSDELDAVGTLAVQEGNLVIDFGRVDVVLTPEAKDQFRGDFLTVTLTAEGFVVDTEAARNVTFRKLR